MKYSYQLHMGIHVLTNAVLLNHWLIIIKDLGHFADTVLVFGIHDLEDVSAHLIISVIFW